VRLDDTVSGEEMLDLIGHSSDLVAARLTKVR
jgi:predicted DNA-binding protein (MmcQ/YjbR family)